MDVDRSKKLDYEDFRWGLHAARIFLNEEEMKVLFKEYDTKQSGTVDYLKFLDEIKVRMRLL